MLERCVAAKIAEMLNEQNQNSRIIVAGQQVGKEVRDCRQVSPILMQLDNSARRGAV